MATALGQEARLVKAECQGGPEDLTSSCRQCQTVRGGVQVVGTLWRARIARDASLI